MAEGPDDGVDDQFELVRRHGEEGPKAVVGDCPQQAEELQSVLRELLHGAIAASHKLMRRYRCPHSEPKAMVG